MNATRGILSCAPARRAVPALRALVAAVLGLSALASAGRAGEPVDRHPGAPVPTRAATCQDCHRDLPSAEAFSRTAHHKSKCNDCHIGSREEHGTRDGERLPDVEIETIGCLDCHLLQATQMGDSVHGGIQIPALASKVSPGPAEDEEDEEDEEEDEDEEDAAAVAAARNCVICHDVHHDPKKSDPVARHSRGRSAELCGQCHRPEPLVATLPEGRGGTAYGNWSSSVHGCRLSTGVQESATCTDCHGSHAVLPLEDPAAPVRPRNIPETCGACHEKEATAFRTSIHGQALARGASLAPSCTDCHGIHAIGPASPAVCNAPEEGSEKGEDASSVLLASLGFESSRSLQPRVPPTRSPRSSLRSPRMPSATSREELRGSCVRCHSRKEIEREYGVSTDWVATWSASFHGLAARGGSGAVADCVSCHGAHDVLPSENPLSRVSPSRVVETCDGCHPGAGPNFAGVPVHGALSGTPAGIGPSLPSHARLLYLLLIPAVIGLMLLHNGLDLTARLRRAWRLRRRGRGRWSRAQWIQYGWFAGAFGVLATTGFAHLFPDAWWVRLLGLTEGVRARLHRGGAIALLAVVIVHAVWIVRTRGGRAFVRGLLPRGSDLRDLARSVASLLRLRVPGEGSRPFTYVEKSDYWAALWGSFVMGLTGLALWFEMVTLALAPGWAFEVARIVHLGEASLAVLAVIVWHLYPVVVRPALKKILAAQATEEATGVAEDVAGAEAGEAGAKEEEAPAGASTMWEIVWSFTRALRALDPRTIVGMARPGSQRPDRHHARTMAARHAGERRSRRRASSHPRPVRRGQRSRPRSSTGRSARPQTETHGTDAASKETTLAPSRAAHPDRAAPLEPTNESPRSETWSKESSR